MNLRNSRCRVGAPRSTWPDRQWLRRLGITALLLGSFCAARPAFAAAPSALSGAIYGEVENPTGIVQMGATVLLYNGSDQLVRQALTNAQGRFAFDALLPGVYSLRVLLASFVPAERRNISVLPSTENRLQIHLSSVFSTVDLTPSSARGTLMNDDWKWVLRSSQSTRPVMRFLPDPPSSSSSNSLSSALSNTSGVLKLSAGDGESLTTGLQQDVGTAFAVATSLGGTGRLQFSGDLGYAANSGAPAGGIRTSFSKPVGVGSSPEVVLTMRQLSLTPRSGTGVAVGTDSAPVLRTMSLAFVDKAQISDVLTVDYGFDMQTISYVDRLNYMSPFLRATWDAGGAGKLRLAYSSGAQPAELLARDSAEPGSFDPDLAALAVFPRISLSDSHVAVERTQNMEIGYEAVAGSRTFSIGAYHEAVSNAAFMLSAPVNFVPAGDLLPDLNSSSSIFNVGSYQRNGYTAGVAQRVGDNMEIGVAAGRTGALLAPGQAMGAYTDVQDLRSGIHYGQRAWATVRASVRIPKAGTKIITDYGWTDFSALMPTHVFLTERVTQDVGWNVYVRQPLPLFPGMPWRLEMTADLRNILAQGYLPLGTGTARSVLTNSPRAVRGGLSFIF